MNARLPFSAGGLLHGLFIPGRARPARHCGSSVYVEAAGTGAETIAVPFGVTVGRAARNHPAESQERGTENSDKPQSRQIWTSGEGVTGGWLNVRGLFR